ncbi:MAG: hypothetical protein HZB53_02280 [Chloroflexi bacterium]|nr:hypothetical protein [Chloroflexota bacterium]
MSRSALSVSVFGVYLVGMGVSLFLAPNLIFSLFGIPPVTDIWARVVGVLALVLAYYYLSAARAGLTAFFQWTVTARIGVFVLFAALVPLFAAPPQLIMFGTVDLLGAVWTWWALRKG